MSEAVDNPVTAGTMLRFARELQGTHIATLAAVLKVPVSKLEALEADNYAFLSDIVFTRALAASVCRSLKIETQEILALLPQNKSQKLIQENRGLNTKIMDRSSVFNLLVFSKYLSQWIFSRSVIVGITCIFLIAAGVYLMSLQQGGDKNSFFTSALESVSSVKEAGDVINPVIVAIDQRSSILSSESGLKLPELAVAKNMLPTQVETISSTDLYRSDLNETADTPVGTAMLSASGDSWVQVKDGTGTTIMQKNLVAGENITVFSPPPLKFIIGRTNVTEVLVHGKPFDLSGVTRDNVARFEVK